MSNIKILNKIKQLSKAYTEGVYSDSPANRKLGRVGMSYSTYSQKSEEKKSTLKKEDKKLAIQNTDNDIVIVKKGSEIDKEVYNLVPSFPKSIRESKFAILKNGKVIAGLMRGEEDNSYKADIAIIPSERNKGLSKKLLVAMIKDFVDNSKTKQIKLDVVNKKMLDNLKNNFGFSSIWNEEEGFHNAILSRKQAIDFLNKNDKFNIDKQNKTEVFNKDINIDKIFKTPIKEKTKTDITTFFIKRFDVKEKYQVPLDKRKNLWEGVKSTNIKIENIVPSQDYLNPDIVKKYLKEENKEIPLGISIKGKDWESNKIILFDGHHRVAADILKGKKEIPIKLIGSYGLFQQFKNK